MLATPQLMECTEIARFLYKLNVSIWSFMADKVNTHLPDSWGCTSSAAGIVYNSCLITGFCGLGSKHILRVPFFITNHEVANPFSQIICVFNDTGTFQLHQNILSLVRFTIGTLFTDWVRYVTVSSFNVIRSTWLTKALEIVRIFLTHSRFANNVTHDWMLCTCPKMAPRLPR